MTDDRFRLTAYLATLAAIVLLSKIGGTGADMAIMTGLVGVLGGLIAGRAAPERQKVEVDQPQGKPVPTEDVRP